MHRKNFKRNSDLKSAKREREWRESGSISMSLSKKRSWRESRARRAIPTFNTRWLLRGSFSSGGDRQLVEPRTDRSAVLPYDSLRACYLIIDGLLSILAAVEKQRDISHTFILRRPSAHHPKEPRPLRTNERYRSCAVRSTEVTFRLDFVKLHRICYYRRNSRNYL